MGVCYMLLDHSRKEYLDLGKCFREESFNACSDRAVVKFLVDRMAGGKFEIIDDIGNSPTDDGTWKNVECVCGGEWQGGIRVRMDVVCPVCDDE